MTTVTVVTTPSVLVSVPSPLDDGSVKAAGKTSPNQSKSGMRGNISHSVENVMLAVYSFRNCYYTMLYYFCDLAQDCSNSSALAMELPPPCDIDIDIDKFYSTCRYSYIRKIKNK